MSVKRMSGGGGQGNSPNAAVRGVHYFGQTNRAEIARRAVVDATTVTNEARQALALLKAKLPTVMGSEQERLARAIFRVNEAWTQAISATLPLDSRLAAAAQVTTELGKAIKSCRSARKAVQEPKIAKPDRATTQSKSKNRKKASLQPAGSYRGIRQRLCLILEQGPEKFGLDQSEVVADLLKLPNVLRGRGKAPAELANDETMTWVTERYEKVFLQLT